MPTPVILWTNFLLTAQHLAEKLKKKYSVGVLTGDTPAAIRQDIVEQFQANNLEILIAHPAVGKFGYTLTAGRTAIYVERSYNGDDYYQSLHRVKRIGTVESPYIIHLLSSKPGSNAPTVDRVIHQVLKSRKDNSIALTSGEIKSLFKGGTLE